MAAGTYDFGWIKLWSNSISYGASFLTYLLRRCRKRKRTWKFRLYGNVNGSHGARVLSQRAVRNGLANVYDIQLKVTRYQRSLNVNRSYFCKRLASVVK